MPSQDRHGTDQPDDSFGDVEPVISVFQLTWRGWVPPPRVEPELIGQCVLGRFHTVETETNAVACPKRVLHSNPEHHATGPACLRGFRSLLSGWPTTCDENRIEWQWRFACGIAFQFAEACSGVVEILLSLVAFAFERGDTVLEAAE